MLTINIDMPTMNPHEGGRQSGTCQYTDLAKPKVMYSILVVDDSATMRRMVIASLRALADVQYNEASTGLEAIERLALAPVDLIILDLNMPDMHGIEVLHFVRSHERYRAIPVIILTTRGDNDSRAVAL